MLSDSTRPLLSRTASTSRFSEAKKAITEALSERREQTEMLSHLSGLTQKCQSQTAHVNEERASVVRLITQVKDFVENERSVLREVDTILLDLTHDFQETKSWTTSASALLSILDAQMGSCQNASGSLLSLRSSLARKQTELFDWCVLSFGLDFDDHAFVEFAKTQRPKIAAIEESLRGDPQLALTFDVRQILTSEHIASIDRHRQLFKDLKLNDSARTAISQLVARAPSHGYNPEIVNAALRVGEEMEWLQQISSVPPPPETATFSAALRTYRDAAGTISQLMTQITQQCIVEIANEECIARAAIESDAADAYMTTADAHLQAVQQEYCRMEAEARDAQQQTDALAECQRREVSGEVDGARAHAAAARYDGEKLEEAMFAAQMRLQHAMNAEFSIRREYFRAESLYEKELSKLASAKGGMADSMRDPYTDSILASADAIEPPAVLRAKLAALDAVLGTVPADASVEEELTRFRAKLDVDFATEFSHWQAAQAVSQQITFSLHDDPKLAWQPIEGIESWHPQPSRPSRGVSAHPFNARKNGRK